MSFVLFFIGLLFYIPAFAEDQKITVWDQACVATEVRACLSQYVFDQPWTCPAGELPGKEKCKSVYPYNTYRDLKNPKLHDAFQFCEKIITYSMAPAKCAHAIDIPSAAQLDTFNKNFQSNFRQALEKAFPPKAAEPSAPPTPTPAPTKP